MSSSSVGPTRAWTARLSSHFRAVLKGFVFGMAIMLAIAVSGGLLMSRGRANRVVRASLNVQGIAHPTEHVGGDYFSDCVLLAMLTARSDGLVRNVLESWIPPQIVTGGHPCDQVERHATGSLPYATPPAAQPYVNYWVGTRHLDAVVLRVVPYATAERLYLLASYASIVILALGCWIGDRRAFMVLLPIFGTLLIAFEVHLQGSSLGHAPGFFFGFMLLAVFAAWHRRFERFEARLGFVALLAVITTFFDPLNGQIVVMLSLAIVLNHFVYARLAAWRDVMMQGLAIAACFLACFIAFNVLHLIALSFFHDRVWQSYLSELGVRLGSQADAKTIGARDVASRLWEQRKNLVLGGVVPSTVFLVGGLVSWLFAGLGLLLAVRLNRHQRLWMDLIVLSTGVVGVLAWYELFTNHTFVHAWFMVRTLSLPSAYGVVAVVVAAQALTVSRASTGIRSRPTRGPSPSMHSRWEASGKVGAP